MLGLPMSTGNANGENPGGGGHRAFGYVLLVLCSALACSPVFYSRGLFLGSDWWYELVRIAEYAHVLGQGVFPVRWAPDLHGGYGSPIFIFYPPVFLTLAGVLSLAGLSFVVSTKAAVLLVTLAAALGMYLFARELFGERGGIVSGCLYVLAPYRFVDAFVRNAFAELTAMAVAPFVFYAITRILKGEGSHRGAQAVLALSAALFVLSHNLSVVMYLPVMTLYAVVFAALGGGLRRLGRLAAPLAVAALLSAFYVLPVILEMKHIQLWRATEGKFDVLRNLVTPGSLVGWTSWYSTTLFAPVLGVESLVPWQKFAGYLVALFSPLLAVLSLAAIAMRRRKLERPVLGVLAAFALLTALYAALMTPASAPFWRNAGFLGILQFPWRLLSPATFMLSALGGAVAYFGGRRPLLLILLAAVFLIVACPFWVLHYIRVPDEALSAESIRANKYPATVTGEYLPVWVGLNPLPPEGEGFVEARAAGGNVFHIPGWLVRDVPSPREEVVEVEGEGGGAEALREGPESFAYRVSLPGEAKVLMNVFYFPGWKVYADGRPADFEITPQGLMRLALPAGEHIVEARFEDTPVRAASKALSIGGLLGLLWLLASAAPAGRKGRGAGGRGGRDGV
jgi:hypothetical protein